MLPEGRKKTANCRKTATKKETARVGEKIWKAGAKAASESLAVLTGAQQTRNRRSINRNRNEAARTTIRNRSDAPDLEIIIRRQTRLIEELMEHQRRIRESLDKQSRASGTATRSETMRLL